MLEKKSTRVSLFCLAAASSFAVLLRSIWNHGFGQDWDFFNATSLLTRSIILHYHKFPIHDPWISGGVDILTNPFNRIFSPALLLDLLFPPMLSNAFYVVLYGLLGIWGMYRLLLLLDVERGWAFVGGVLFANSSYFGLHLAVGHVDFALVQLIPWVLVCMLQLEKPIYQVWLTAVLSLIILDGNGHALVFSLILIGVGISLKPSIVSVRPSLVLGSAFVLLSCAKIIPALHFVGFRVPHFVSHPLSIRAFLTALFNPVQHSDLAWTAQPPFPFHEVGCYIGIVATGVVLTALAHRQFRKENWKLVVWTLVFLWVATGWGRWFNPWTLVEKIPVINNVRINSRAFVLFALFFILVLIQALRHLSGRRLKWVLAAFLIVESFVVKNYPFFYEVKTRAASTPLREMIQSRTIDGTVLIASKPLHYYNLNKGSFYVDGPTRTNTYVVASSKKNYRGEVYWLDQRGEAALLSFIPGEIRTAFKSDRPGRLQFNTNALHGWRVADGNAGLVETTNGLLTVDVGEAEGTLTLRYWPSYLSWLLIAYGAGWALFLWALWRVLKKKPLK